MTEIILSGEHFEVDSDNIAQTYQVADIGDISKTKGNFTNKIKIPNTPDNVRRLKYLGVVGNQSRKPYEKLPAKLLVEGFELMPNGFAAVQSDAFDVQIYDGNMTLAEKLKGKTMKGLNYQPLNHILNISTFLASLQNTGGYIHAGADYGRWDDSFSVEYNPGALFIYTLWDMVFSESGMTYSGAIFAKDKFKGLVTTPERGHTITGNTSSIVLGTAGITPISKTIQGINAPQIVSEYFKFTAGANKIASTPDELIFEFAGICRINYNGAASFVMDEGFVIEEPKVKIVFKGLELYFDVDDFGSIDLYVKPGDTLELKVIGKVTERNQFTINADADLTFLEITANEFVDYSLIMPEVPQVDFVKDIMQRFGLICRPTETGFEFIEIEELFKNKSTANDWSGKFIDRSEDYTVQGYAARNRFAYDYQEQGQTFGDGIMTVQNEHLEDESTLITSIFRASGVSRNAYGMDVYGIPLWEAKERAGVITYEAKQDKMRLFELTELRMVRVKPEGTLNGIEVLSPLLTFAGCHYQIFVNDYYQMLNVVLNNYIKVNGTFALDFMDIYQLDFFRLKYIEQLGGYFFLNKVSAFVSGQDTKCELIKVL